MKLLEGNMENASVHWKEQGLSGQDPKSIGSKSKTDKPKSSLIAKEVPAFAEPHEAVCCKCCLN
jgi:hypothetical protein